MFRQSLADGLAARFSDGGLVAYVVAEDGRTLGGPVPATMRGTGGEYLTIDAVPETYILCWDGGSADVLAIYSPKGRVMEYPIRQVVDIGDRIGLTP